MVYHAACLYVYIETLLTIISDLISYNEIKIIIYFNITLVLFLQLMKSHTQPKLLLTINIKCFLKPY